MTDMIRREDALAALARYRAHTWAASRDVSVQDPIAAIAALPAVTVGVRKLVWEEPCTSNNHVHIARSIFGDYYIYIDFGQHIAWLEAHTKPYENAIGEVVGSVYAAQALAQADYEARILAALEPVAAPVTEDQKLCFMQGAPFRRAERIERWSSDEQIKAMLREPVAAPDHFVDATKMVDPAAIREAEPSTEWVDHVEEGFKIGYAEALREALKALDQLPEYGSPDVNIGVSNAYAAILALIPTKGAADDRA